MSARVEFNQKFNEDPNNEVYKMISNYDLKINDEWFEGFNSRVTFEVLRALSTSSKYISKNQDANIWNDNYTWKFKKN